MRVAPGVAALVLAAVAAGCGGSGSDRAQTATKTATEAPRPPELEPAPTTEAADPLEGASTDPVRAHAPTAQTALLERVALGRHDGYDRVVFRFRNTVPGYSVEYVLPPLKEDGSGDPIDVDGSAFVAVRMEPASGFDVATAEGEQTYAGPRRVSGARAGTLAVREVVRTGDFEAVLTWAVGLGDRVAFRVTKLESPPRLVLDFAHE